MFAGNIIFWMNDGSHWLSATESPGSSPPPPWPGWMRGKQSPPPAPFTQPVGGVTAFITLHSSVLKVRTRIRCIVSFFRRELSHLLVEKAEPAWLTCPWLWNAAMLSEITHCGGNMSTRIAGLAIINQVMNWDVMLIYSLNAFHFQCEVLITSHCSKWPQLQSQHPVVCWRSWKLKAGCRAEVRAHSTNLHQRIISQTPLR